MLRDLPLKRRYRSNEDNLLRGFYIPCLRESRRYSRAVGFFSSAALSLAAQGLPSFLRNGGRMRLVASPELSPLDIDAMEAGYERRRQLVEESVTGALSFEDFPDPIRERLGFLGWLIERQLLDIKIALVAGDAGFGIYHEKVGIFEDAAGDRVVFQGSANESRGGLLANFESILVFRSWEPRDRDDVEMLETDFEALWENKTRGLEVFEFPDTARELLRAMSPPDPPRTDPEELAPAEEDVPPALSAEPRLPDALELREYQRRAMAAWFRHEGRGVLEMATGTGKTVTALAAAERLYRAVSESGRSLMIIVVCPYQHLVRQWADAAREFGLSPILCYRSRQLWSGPLSTAVREIRHRHAPCHIAIATNATFQTPHFRAIVDDSPEVTMLLADEVHNLGAERLQEALPAQARYRLGLSATPERWFDPTGTEALFSYFGDVVFEFGLRDAIEAGALTPYDYYPRIVYLDGEEVDEYVDLTQRLAKYLGGGSDDPAAAEGPLKLLLIRRARVIANAAAKLAALRECAEPIKETTQNLFYCGDGSRQHDTGYEAERQLDGVMRLLGRKVGMRVHRYTAETALNDRDILRERFAAGDLQGLVAIRCLDEGVDIPATERAFILASSSNPRQFIQRRGRVLRLSPGTGKRHAEIYDFLAVPPPDVIDAETWKTERRLVQRELERVTRFAELARNGPQALAELRELRDRYDLLHV